MIRLLCIVLSSVLLNATLISFIVGVSAKFELFDTADLYRKNHEVYVSRLGGVGIFLTLNIVVLLFIKDNSSIYGILKVGAILFLLGLKDDLLGGAKPVEKFFMQSLAMGLLLAQKEYQEILLFSNIYDGQFSQILNPLGIFFFMLFIINSFNLIDGIDGLAGVIGVVVNIYLSLQLLSFGYEDYAFIGLITSGSLIGFLKNNLLHRRIFMGDAGAMLVGFVSVVLSLKFLRAGYERSEDVCFAPIALLTALLIVPIFDSIRILVIRYFHGKPLLKGDRNHIHHRLKDIGFRDSQVVCILTTYTICISCFVICFQTLGDRYLLIVIFFSSLVGNLWLSYRRGKVLSHQYRLMDVILKDTLNIRRNIFRRDS